LENRNADLQSTYNYIVSNPNNLKYPFMNDRFLSNYSNKMLPQINQQLQLCSNNSMIKNKYPCNILVGIEFIEGVWSEEIVYIKLQSNNPKRNRVKICNLKIWNAVGGAGYIQEFYIDYEFSIIEGIPTFTILCGRFRATQTCLLIETGEIDCECLLTN
jgi:hypothetical protein